jgi:hypothetical protein
MTTSTPPFDIPAPLTLEDLLDNAERAVIDRVRLATNHHDPATWVQGVMARAGAEHDAGRSTTTCSRG